MGPHKGHGPSMHALYLDGNLDGVKRWEAGSTPADWELLHGKGNGLTIGSLAMQREQLEGDIADVRLWTVARTTRQLRAHIRLRLCGSSTHGDGGRPRHRAQIAFNTTGLWGAWSMTRAEFNKAHATVDNERRELVLFADCSGHKRHAVQFKESSRVAIVQPMLASSAEE